MEGRKGYVPYLSLQLETNRALLHWYLAVLLSRIFREASQDYIVPRHFFLADHQGQSHTRSNILPNTNNYFLFLETEISPSRFPFTMDPRSEAIWFTEIFKSTSSKRYVHPNLTPTNTNSVNRSIHPQISQDSLVLPIECLICYVCGRVLQWDDLDTVSFWVLVS